ncbi:tubulin polymerization-promoting protein homolog [Chelonus insularis]|uniref:tubulin polymerization-promoting protein homolog n=1 Tax=Chelonus insularis TaxID=460826 RepID=UPI00158A3EBC|nr:tubulin polymerization-promoting protein homolog [Chelonus insularis]
MLSSGPSKQTKIPPIVVPLIEMFEAYCDLDLLADIVDADLLPFSQLKKWFMKAKVIDMSRVTITDAFLCFFQFKKRAISYEEFLAYLEDLAEAKELNLKEIKHKLQTCGKPIAPRHNN